VTGPFQGGSSPARVAVVVVTYESRDLALAALDSLAAHGGLPLEVVVVDNASADGTAAALRERHPRARVLANAENRGFAHACNQGWRALSAVFDRRPEAGVAGPRTLNEDGTVQVSTGEDLTIASERRQRRLVSGVRARRPGALAEAEARHSREHEPDWVSGACLLARWTALQAVGGLDDGFFLYEEDADLCRRIRAAGFRVVFTPEAVVRHRLGRSMGKAAARARAEYDRSHLRYYRKHNGPLQTALLRAWMAATGRLG
jgi:GT2 family glycosyltransferase